MIIHTTSTFHSNLQSLATRADLPWRKQPGIVWFVHLGDNQKISSLVNSGKADAVGWVYKHRETQKQSLVCWHGLLEQWQVWATKNWLHCEIPVWNTMKNHEKSITISHSPIVLPSTFQNQCVLEFCFASKVYSFNRPGLCFDLFLMRRQRLYWWRLTPPWWNKNANSHVKNFTATAHSVHHQAWRFPNHGSSNLWETVIVWCLKIMKILERRASGHWKKMGVDIQPNCTALIRFV